MRYVWLALVLLLFLGVAGAGGLLYTFYHYGRGLPEYAQLADYEPPPLDPGIREELAAFVARRKEEGGAAAA